MATPPLIQLPVTLSIEVVPDINGMGGKANLRASDWVTLSAGESLRIVPAKGDVFYDSERGTFRIEVTLAPLRTAPKIDPPLIILP